MCRVYSDECQRERKVKTEGGLRAFRIGWTGFVVAAAAVPYLLNWLSTPVGYHYTWIVPPYPEDSFAYMAWSRQAANGDLLLRLKYTAVPHAGFLFHPFFLLCGWMTAASGLDPGIVLWVVKIAGGVILLLSFYRYTDYLGLGKLESIVASILVGQSTGVGAFLLLFGLQGRLPVVPADVWMPELNTFTALFWNALFPYSLTLIVLSIYFLDRGTRDGRKLDLSIAGLSTGLLVLLHPYSVPLLFAIAAVIIVVRRRANSMRYLGCYFATSLPFVLYVLLMSVLHPLASEHSAHGQMKSPPLAAYLLGLGLVVPLCVAGLAAGGRELLKRYWHLLLWAVLCMALSYFPFWFQRKLIFSAHIPLCILGGVSFDLILRTYLGPLARQRVQTTAAIGLLLVLGAAQVRLLAANSREVRNNAESTYFVSSDVIEGFKFLKDRSKPDEIVFARWQTSRMIPASSGNTVLWGHWAQSVDLGERGNWYIRLFAASSQDGGKASRDFWGAGIKYVFADGTLKREVETNGTWAVILKDAEEVFANRRVTIYRHKEGGPSRAVQ